MRENYPNLKFQTGKGAAPAFWTPSSQTFHSRLTPLRCLSLNTPGHPDHPSHTSLIPHWSPVLSPLALHVDSVQALSIIHI